MRGVHIFWFILALTQSGCCMLICDCFDESDAAIAFEFNLDSTTSGAFRKEELANTYFIRSVNGVSPVDTLDRIDTSEVNGNRYWLSFVIRNDPHIEHYENPDTYKIVNDSLNLNLAITHIIVHGNIPNKLCCNCYSNEYIKYKVNGIDFEHKSSNGRSNASYLINKP